MQQIVAFHLLNNYIIMENLKKVLLPFIKVGMKVEDSLADKKISAMEGIGIAIEALGFIKAFKAVGLAIEEWKTSTEEQKLEVVEWVKTELDLDNDNIELIVEGLIDALAKIADSFLLLAPEKTE